MPFGRQVCHTGGGHVDQVITWLQEQQPVEQGLEGDEEDPLDHVVDIELLTQLLARAERATDLRHRVIVVIDALLRCLSVDFQEQVSILHASLLCWTTSVHLTQQMELFSNMRRASLTPFSTLRKCSLFQRLCCWRRPDSRSRRKASSCSRTRLCSQEAEFFRITLRIGCQSSERSEPSVTEASTFTRRPVLCCGTPRTYSDCLPTSLRRFSGSGGRGLGWNSLHCVDAGMLSAGIHQHESGSIPDVVVGHIELLQELVLCQALGQVCGAGVTQACVHQRQPPQRAVPREGLQQMPRPCLHQGDERSSSSSRCLEGAQLSTELKMKHLRGVMRTVERRSTLRELITSAENRGCFRKVLVIWATVELLMLQPRCSSNTRLP
ncbi:hypothetical protein JZ751_001992 [Albula glossodonta]|uniref:Uncharacterized protein n=1 Tax=Albula glossodonta TaxID=121402 RepID=A0A8T2PHI0_9TELE|nr:hypothetical protein JZ751_001992 [Albula glossodonta]